MCSMHAEHSRITEKVAFSAKVHFLVDSTGAPAAGRAWEAQQAPETEFLWRDQGASVRASGPRHGPGLGQGPQQAPENQLCVKTRLSG